MVKSVDKRELLLEDLCVQGCQVVNEILTSEQSQTQCEPFQQLKQDDQQWVLSELESIMRVYK